MHGKSPQATNSYCFSGIDGTIVKAAKLMLNRVIKSHLPSSAQVVSVAKLLHIFERLPRLPYDEPICVTVTSPRRMHGEIETFFWWTVTQTEQTIRVTGNGHYYHPSSGGDSFSVFYWEATPETQGEYLDYSVNLHMVPDLQDFELSVSEMNLSEAGYKVAVEDDSNELLNDDDDTIEEIDDDSGADSEDDEDGESVVWEAVAHNPVENEYLRLIDPDKVSATAPQFGYGLDDCGTCGRSLSGCGLAIDGRLKSKSMWGNFCASCHSKAGEGIGWGVGQLYARQTNGCWRLVAGFPN